MEFVNLCTYSGKEEVRGYIIQILDEFGLSVSYDTIGSELVYYFGEPSFSKESLKEVVDEIKKGRRSNE